jgi:hypothetical protein
METGVAAARALESSDYWLLTFEFSATVAISEVSRNLDMALDRFQELVFDPQAALGSNEFLHRLAFTLDLWPTPTVIDFSPAVQETFRIDDEDEGRKLERAILTVVNSIYPENSYRSPQTEVGGSIRELCDVLGFNEQWRAVVQAKALAVFMVNADRSSERRKSSVTKGVTKALRQLSGAMRKIRENAPVFEGGHEAIPIADRQTLAHAIVVLSLGDHLKTGQR